MLSVHLIHSLPGGGSPRSAPLAGCHNKLGSGRRGKRILGEICWKYDHQGNLNALFVSGHMIRQLDVFCAVILRT
ncbi:hypothetical protein CesoFtcFv8_021142 [Champsocephalus esox]|uniref:Uncharacterized protein n=2 Tax=Champsocephalus TaxID=52236 RepID=A0AAN8CUC8_CHAGU|nr:hypothetical protein CesoFtcFv8_021142 [Champsocephalus esox]KAK5908628.1 hypothetical protein CgunFtcFv8_016667 [Champsocephalus gunnari]